MRRSWSVVDFILIWLGGLIGSAFFLAVGVALGDEDVRLLLGLAGQYVGNLGVFWIIWRRKDQPDVGFVIRGADAAYLGLGLILQIAVAALLLPLSNLLFPDGRPRQEMADIIAGADTAMLQVGLVLAAVVLAPVTEELMFRGVLLKALEPKGRTLTLLVTSAAFTLVHLLGLDLEMLWQSAVVVLPPIFGLGLLLGWLTQRTGRLGPAIFLHSGWNLLAAFVLLLPEDLLEQIGS
ncbi:MAG TPA: type II CAAX endopeptidase family protein [Acidimicrobiia bacterium]|nr:type II CAAX endopeptidase family protein [Acidimicrobiia bacterium]